MLPWTVSKHFASPSRDWRELLLLLLLPPVGAAEWCKARAAGVEGQPEESPERERGAAGGQTGKTHRLIFFYNIYLNEMGLSTHQQFCSCVPPLRLCIAHALRMDSFTSAQIVQISQSKEWEKLITGPLFTDFWLIFTVSGGKSFLYFSI